MLHLTGSISLVASLNDLEKASKKYAEIKQAGKNAESADLVAKIIDSISSPEFSFKVRDEALVSNDTTSYVYENNETYPFLLDFLAEILHVKIPIAIEDAKFGAGEILVTHGLKVTADARLASAVKELQKLVRGKREQALSKFADNPA
jgi:hypothetical protein